jgi:hypothetical protein
MDKVAVPTVGAQLCCCCWLFNGLTAAQWLAWKQAINGARVVGSIGL